MSSNSYTLDMRPVYDYIRYDGISYVRVSDGSEIKKHPNPDVGTIFEIGRLMIEHGVCFDGASAPKNSSDAQKALDAKISTWRYRVFRNEELQPYEATASAIVHLLSEAGVERESALWHAVLREAVDISCSRAGREVSWRFDGYLAKPLFEQVQ